MSLQMKMGHGESKESAAINPPQTLAIFKILLGYIPPRGLRRNGQINVRGTEALANGNSVLVMVFG